MKQKTILATINISLITLGLTSSAEAAFHSRLNGQAYYDDVTDLTWLADANHALTSGYAALNERSASVIEADTTDIYLTGAMGWDAANEWAEQLTVSGVGGWRLPTTIDFGNDGPTYTNGNFYTGVDAGSNITVHSEMSNIFYNIFGGLANTDINGNTYQPGWGLGNSDPISNIQRTFYWSATSSSVKDDHAWYFNMSFGDQNEIQKKFDAFAWAVQSGDVSEVPIPSTLLLLVSGLLGITGIARKKR